ncbi:MAG: YceI family protein [Rubrivivax sp.]|nr:YceI family protein [Rubrivivax sp.]
MRRVAASFLLVSAVVAAGGASAQPAVYLLDPQHSFVHFEVLHFGTSTSRGRFGTVEGHVELDVAQRRGAVSVRIPVGSVDTGLTVFDARLRRDDLLAADAHPLAFFVGSDFRFDGDRVAAVRGDLTLRGVGRTVTLRALRFACRDDARLGAQVCGGDFETFVDRSAFGADFGLPFVADRVRIVVQVEGVRR